LKDEVTEMKKKAVANQKLMHDISHENQRLKAQGATPPW